MAEKDRRMIRGHRFPHLCCGDFCAICAWEGRKLAARAPRPRIKIVARIGLCSCGWCLRKIGENAIMEPPLGAVNAVADSTHDTSEVPLV
jgi:hypothetical protein